MIKSRVIYRNHAKELEFRTLCWNLMSPTLDTVPVSHTSGSAVFIIWIAYENEGTSKFMKFFRFQTNYFPLGSSRKN
jgi:hypothetical protein